MAAQAPPILFQQVLDLTSLGIQSQHCTFQTLTMESEKYICVREKPAENVPNAQGKVVIVELDNPTKPVSHAITADSVIMSPTQFVLALRSGPTLQTFKIDEKIKLKACNMTEPVVYWRWLTSSIIAIVTTKSVYHWDMDDKSSEPVKMYDRLKELQDAQIISYRADASLKWFSLVAITKENNRIVGWTQLYSLEKNVAQALKGQAALFTKYNLPGTNQELTLFCLAQRAPGENKLVIREVSRTNGSPESSNKKFGHVSSIQFDENQMNDFPVCMEASPKYNVIYLVTMTGNLHIFDIATGRLIYGNKIAQDQDTIFVATPSKGGILGVNRSGKVLSINLNESLIIPFLIARQETEVATKLAARAGLPGADQLFTQHFNALIQQGRYTDAARVVAEAPPGLLRTQQTISLFQNLPPRPNEMPPITQYFGALMERGQLNKVESTTLVRMLIQQGKKDLLDKWTKEDKLDYSKDVADLVRTVDINLALFIYERAGCKDDVVFILAQLGQFPTLVAYAQKHQFTPDWLKILSVLAGEQPDGALALAKILLTAQPAPLVDRNAVVEIFENRKLLQQLTFLLIDVLQGDKEEDGPLQTRLLELDLNAIPAVAEDIFRQKLFSKFNHKRIAELCERAGLLHRALEFYGELSDRKRVLKNAHLIQPPEFVVDWFNNLGKQESMECLKDMLVANPKANLPIVVMVATRFYEIFTAPALVELFDSVKSYEGTYAFLNPLLPLIPDANMHFKFIEAAARLGHIADVERVCRESKYYDPEKVRDFLKEINLPDARPLIIVCNEYGFIADMTKFLIKRSMRSALEIYVTQINPANSPLVIGTLLDVDDASGGDDFIKQLLNAVGPRCPIESLVDEVEKRNRLKLLQGWLEARAREGNTEPALHNALAKIYVDARNDPEKFLNENRYYDHLNVGKYCESRDPQLAFVAYKTAAGTCDDELIAICNKAILMKQLAAYCISQRDSVLWSKVLAPENDEHRKAFVDHVQSALAESKVPNEVICAVQAFQQFNLSNDLIGLVEKIIFEGNPLFAQNSNLQNLLITTATECHTPENPTKVMEYIQRLDKYECDYVAGACLKAHLYEEAFTAYNKFGKFVSAIDVLVHQLASLQRASSYAEQVDKPEVFSRLGKAQLDSALISDSISSFIKANDAQYYHEMISAVSSSGDEKLFKDLIRYLRMARSISSESKIDSELLYAYARTGGIAEMEQMLLAHHRANALDVGERCFDEGNYQAAKVLFQAINNYGRLAITLVKLDDLSAAVEMAKKANAVPTWKAVSKACIVAKNFKLAKTCGLNIIVHADELVELIRFYENRGHFNELIDLLEAGSENDRAHPGLFTELAILYAQHKTDKLMEHLRHHSQHLNVTRVGSACETNLLWKEYAYLLHQDKDFDKCINIMMDHPSAFDAQTFPSIVAKSNGSDNIARAVRFYIEEHAGALSELLSAIAGKIDHRRIIDISREKGALPLIKPFLQKVQDANNQVVNEALNDLLIDEEDYNALRVSIETYNAFESIALAKRLEKHELLEFRRIAAALYKSKGKWTLAVDLYTADKLYEEAMQAASESKDGKLAEGLLQFFISEGHPEAFAAATFHCYDIIRPDVVMELAWKNKLTDFAWPYMIQQMRSYALKVDQLAEAMLKRREETQAIMEHQYTMTGSMPPHMGTNPTMGTIPMGTNPPNVMMTTGSFPPQQHAMPPHFGSNPGNFSGFPSQQPGFGPPPF